MKLRLLVAMLQAYIKVLIKITITSLLISFEFMIMPIKTIYSLEHLSINTGLLYHPNSKIGDGLKTNVATD